MEPKPQHHPPGRRGAASAGDLARAAKKLDAIQDNGDGNFCVTFTPALVRGVGRERRLRVARERLHAPRLLRARTAPRRRGAGRPRAAASRSGARSGDSGDSSGPGGDEPPAAPRAALTLRRARADVAVELIASGRASGAADLRERLGWTVSASRLAVGDGILDGRISPGAHGRLAVVA